MKDENNLLVSRLFIADCKRKYKVDFIKMLDAFTQFYFNGKEPDNLTVAEKALFDEKREAVLNDGILE